jgi:hypothetical protein
MVAALLAWSFTSGNQGVGSGPGSSERRKQQEDGVDESPAAAEPHMVLPGWLVKDAQLIKHVADGLGVDTEVTGL